MTKADLIKWAKTNNLDVDSVIKYATHEIKYHGTNWASLRVVARVGTTVKYISPGYRKNTTGEYVPNSYRSNFGWKNTYYQPASLIITFGRLYVDPAAYLKDVPGGINDRRIAHIQHLINTLSPCEFKRLRVEECADENTGHRYGRAKKRSGQCCKIGSSTFKYQLWAVWA